MERHILHKLQLWKQQKQRKPLILSGVRQCGKTYALKFFGKTAFPRTHYFNFEQHPELARVFTANLAPQRIVDELSYFIDTPIDIQRDLVIFDEIQACAPALTSLKYFNETMPELHLCSAGSLLGVTLNQAPFPVGQVNYLPLYPLSFSEFLLALDEKKHYELIRQCTQRSSIPAIAHERLWERMKWYWIVGGLPEVVATFCQHKQRLFEAFTAVREKQKELIFTYYGDIAKHSGKVSAMHIHRLWQSIPSQLARSQDGNAKRFYFKDVLASNNRYNRLASAFDWLKAAGLIIKVPIIDTAELPLSAYTSESHFKCFMFDVGILGAMSKLPFQAILDYDFGTYKGYFAENFVAQALQYSHADTLYSWQKNRAEVEFVLMEENAIVPIEVKSGWITRAKSLNKFVETYHPPYRTIMSGYPLRCDLHNQIHHYPLYLAEQFPLRTI